MREMSDAAFERYAEFLRADPIESILARNLSFLLDDNKLVSAVKLDTSLKNRTENGRSYSEARRICCVMILMDGIGPPAYAFCLRMRCSMITARMPTRSKECAKMQRASLPSRAFARSSGVYSGRD